MTALALIIASWVVLFALCLSVILAAALLNGREAPAPAVARSNRECQQ